MAHAVARAYNIADLRDIARRRLPKGLFEFVDRVMALIGARSVADLTPEILRAPDLPLRDVEPARPGLRLLDTARAAER